MGKKSLFGLDPDQLDRLLSVGTGGEQGSEVKDAKSPPENCATSGEKTGTLGRAATAGKPGGHSG